MPPISKDTYGQGYVSIADLKAKAPIKYDLPAVCGNCLLPWTKTSHVPGERCPQKESRR